MCAKDLRGCLFFSVTLNGPSKTFLFSGFGIAGFKLIGWPRILAVHQRTLPSNPDHSVSRSRDSLYNCWFSLSSSPDEFSNPARPVAVVFMFFRSQPKEYQLIGYLHLSWTFLLLAWKELYYVPIFVCGPKISVQTGGSSGESPSKSKYEAGSIFILHLSCRKHIRDKG